MPTVSQEIQDRRKALESVREVGESRRRFSKRAGISYSTFQRICEGEDIPKAEHFERLHRLYGYTEALAAIQGQSARDGVAGTEHALDRIVEVVGIAGLEKLAYTIEGFARVLGPENVVGHLKKRLEDVHEVKAQGPDRKQKRDENT